MSVIQIDQDNGFYIEVARMCGKERLTSEEADIAFSARLAAQISRDSATQSWETFQSMLSPSDPVSSNE